MDGLDFDAYRTAHAVRGDLLRRLGRNQEAAETWGSAAARTENAKERAFVERRRDALANA